MNDRFKFRLWNKAVKKFIYFNDSELSIDKENMGLLFRSDHLYLGNYEELQQCTGLKDKNGKLIYEGDIVRYSEYDIEDVKPEWEYDEIIWGDKYSYPAFDFKNGNLFDYNGLSYIFNEGWTIEVIGNIYENKELLEEECQK